MRNKLHCYPQHEASFTKRQEWVNIVPQWEHIAYAMNNKYIWMGGTTLHYASNILT